MPEGQVAELIPTVLPDDKEGLEEFFAKRFIEQFNHTLPLGAGVCIENPKQNDTSDLDFSITCPAADYLELAELSPQSEAFGRSALRDGRLNAY
ncbi:MAG TPA: hypothetical protein VET25_01440, partial [Aestuariivirgaceae bacterium]|nr:hypothetical protein [Aestuariivirgaceae bacterium]